MLLIDYYRPQLGHTASSTLMLFEEPGQTHIKRGIQGDIDVWHSPKTWLRLTSLCCVTQVLLLLQLWQKHTGNCQLFNHSEANSFSSMWGQPTWCCFHIFSTRRTPWRALYQVLSATEPSKRALCAFRFYFKHAKQGSQSCTHPQAHQYTQPTFWFQDSKMSTANSKKMQLADALTCWQWKIKVLIEQLTDRSASVWWNINT